MNIGIIDSNKKMKKSTKKINKTVKFIDLFCGGGLGARGAISANSEPLLAVDSWELATRTYQANFPSARIITNAIEDIDIDDIKGKYKPDVLLASPECTSHSIARGARPENQKSKALAEKIIPWIDGLEPLWVVMENVKRMQRWEGHQAFLQSIEERGYTVSDLYLNAADFGTPQSRKRLFVIANRQGLKITKSDLIGKKRRKQRTAETIIDWSENYPSRPLYQKGRAQATIDRAERAIAELGKNIPFIIVYYGSDYAGGWQRVDRPLRTITTLDRFGLVTWKKGKPRLRMLQPLELLKAMGAGDRHVLPFGNRRQQIKLCGNGVCPEIIKSIFSVIHQSYINDNRDLEW